MFKPEGLQANLVDARGRRTKLTVRLDGALGSIDAGPRSPYHVRATNGKGQRIGIAAAWFGSGASAIRIDADE